MPDKDQDTLYKVTLNYSDKEGNKKGQTSRFMVAKSEVLALNEVMSLWFNPSYIPQPCPRSDIKWVTVKPL